MIKNVLLAFIPIFVAVDAIGILPLFVSLTEGAKKEEKSRIIFQSMVTAMCLAVGFIFLGNAVFVLMGITIGDFMVAGGSILFYIAVADIRGPGKGSSYANQELGAVPLGTPLIVGPAVLTSSLIMRGEYGLAATLISVLVNILLAGLILSLSGAIIKVLGKSGSRALSKVTNLLLAAIAVMLIRKGIIQIFHL
ncbi:MAG: MarC family protein [Candidatus Omnitrophota bacterium]|nr:MarC family protein [Candidatus Omnitrophota bacterium]